MLNTMKSTNGQQQRATITFERLVDELEVSRITGRSVNSLRRDRLLGTGISFIKIGALVRYDPQDIRDYIQQNKRRIPSEAR